MTRRAPCLVHAGCVVAVMLFISALAAAEAQPASGQPGNIFLTTDALAVAVDAGSGDRVEYEVIDFWGVAVAKGREPVTSGRAIIKPAVGKGYFTLRVIAKLGDQTVLDRCTSFAVIAPAKPAATDSPFGVTAHFAQGWQTDVMPLLVKAGISSFRDEMYWAELEKERGTFAFPVKSDAYMAEAKVQGLDPLILMNFGNPLYDGGHAPASAEGREAYSRYGEELLKRYGTQIRTIEIWNEYNGSWCGGEAEKDRPKHYAEMIKAAYPRLKALRPDLTVLGCASVLIPLPYIEGVFKHGALPFMDAVVVHPYRPQPEGVEREIADLQALIRTYNNGKDKPIWVTETGAMPVEQEYDWERGKGLWELSRANSARYLVRQYALLLSTGTVARIYWYLSRDYNEFRLMGLLRAPDDHAGRYAVAAPYVAYANLIRQLSGAKPLPRTTLANPFAYVMPFTTGAEEIRVCWATQPTAITLSVLGPVTLVDMVGGEQLLTPAKGRVHLTLTDAPVYVKGKVDAVSEGGRLAIAGRQTVDLLDEFAIAYTGDDPTLSGSIEVAGRSYPISGSSGRVVIPGHDSSRPRSDTLWYRLILDGKPAGAGGVEIAVVDPLSAREAPRFVAPDILRLRLANDSSRNDYTLASVAWKIDRTALTTQSRAGRLIHAHDSIIELPVSEVRPYRSYPVEVGVGLADRAQVHQHAQASYNPCPLMTPLVDGELGDWQGSPEIDLAGCGTATGRGVAGTAHLAWDAANLHVAARVESGAKLTVALAPDVVGAWGASSADLRGWWEFTVDASGTLTVVQGPAEAFAKAKVIAKPGKDGSVYEIAIPWSGVAPIVPAIGASIRLALLVEGREGSVTWGGGIRGGKSPDRFRICLLTPAGNAPAARASGAIAAIPIPVPARILRPLADSLDDFAKQQGANNWFYGYFPGDGKGQGDGRAPSGPYTDDDFQLMSQVQTVWGYTWRGIAEHHTINSNNAEPTTADGRQVWTVRRWKSPVSGAVRLSGFFEHDPQGDGVGGVILVDGVAVWAALVGGPVFPKSAPFDIAVPVHEGATIDFCVNTGTGLETFYDSTGFRAKVELISTGP